ncbi:chorismate mutase [Candidatus Peregrinibacteria bacterium]|nr:chorismate mutase [Candidatus Peregrinibacteria bacterium]
MNDEHPELSRLRQEIDKIDRKIIENIAKRRQISAKIGKYKHLNKLSITQKKREKEVLKERIKDAEKKNIKKKLTRKLFRLIFRDSRKLQKHPSSFDKKPKN